MALRNISIKLNDSKPAISRKLVVPDEMNLSVFHLLIQAAMPWENYHLYEFKVGNERWLEALDEDGIDFGQEPNLIAEEWTIADVVEQTGKTKIIYTYDFGDYWDHTISVGAIVKPTIPNEPYPKLLAANGVCPPEDCGGIDGYYHLLGVLNDPNDDDHEDMKEWVGEDFDPNADAFPALRTEVAKFAHLYQKSSKSK